MAQFITPSSGTTYTIDNVGIGLSNPKSKFHELSESDISQGWAPDALMWLGGGNNSFENQYINFRNPSSTDANDMYWWSSDIIFGRNKNRANWSFKETHGGGLGSTTRDIIAAYITDGRGYSNLQKVIIAPDGGNVGIGLINPSNKLEVNGTIRAKEIKVEADNWPDYVFTPSYELMDLKSTSKFIQEHRHLPGIPSEKEVQNSGIFLGEMNVLLKKIEELMLYTISQEERIDLLLESLQKSDQRFSALEAELASVKHESGISR